MSCSQLEWLVSIPWPNSTTTRPSNALDVLRDRHFLKNAREQLDADHFGLEKIKKRLIEYLAVVRLKALQADHEARQLEEANKNELALVPRDSQLEGSAAAPVPAPLKSPRKNVKGPILLSVFFSTRVRQSD